MLDLKISILWTELSGYINACFKELGKEASDIILVRYPISAMQAPYSKQQFSWISKQFDVSQIDQARQEILIQKPDILLIAGWINPKYLSIAKALKQTGTLVVCLSDNPWRGTLKQQLSRLISKTYLQSRFDRIWVPGKAGEEFALKIGFEKDKIFTGVYSCDTAAFQSVHVNRTNQAPFPKVFLFVGRYLEWKGVKELLLAYESYRSKMGDKAWELWFSGSGVLNDEINQYPAVKNLGFTQPENLPQTLSKAGALVLPSHSENWGVVVHEATSAGLPVITTDACGSSLDLVDHGVNGCIIPAKNVAALEAAMITLSSKTSDELSFYSDASYQISLKYSPQKWVQVLLSGLEDYRDND
jgi:glycosyltransferase involved in cell wall biosynthesis